MRQFLIAIALAIAAPAHAADIATIGCVEDGIDAEGRALIASEAEFTFLEPMSEREFSDELMQIFSKSVSQCVTQHGWSEDASRAAAMFTMAKMMLPVGRRALAARGFDVAKAERLYNELPVEVRERPIDAAAWKMFDASGDGRMLRLNRQHALYLGAFVGYLGMIDSSRAEFIRS